MGESKTKKTGSETVKTTASKVQTDIPELNKLIHGPEMTYGKVQMKFVFIGLGLIALGMILMSGGWMPSPDVWDESIIYSARRTVLAPICILAGLGMQIYAIFKEK
ncbi:MAG TPA: DUF3098 domain-containing protein [Saprospiraceae bacterium]|nr:DUF3098 domain-containing protein [Saprospiraceae bacterium]